MNNLDRAIIKFLSADIVDLEGIDKQDKINEVIALYNCDPSEYGCYWDESGRWHYLSLRTLLNWDIVGDQVQTSMPHAQYSVNIPTGWVNTRFLSNALRHNELEKPFVKVSSNLRLSGIGKSSQFEGNVKIEIICDSSKDEALCDAITWRIYTLLKNQNKLHDAINGIFNCVFSNLIIAGNYDSNIITFDVGNVLMVGV